MLFFFTRTYYSPPLLVDNGHLLFKSIAREKFLFETEFTINPVAQFDQVRKSIHLNKISTKSRIQVENLSCSCSFKSKATLQTAAFHYFTEDIL